MPINNVKLTKKLVGSSSMYLDTEWLLANHWGIRQELLKSELTTRTARLNYPQAYVETLKDHQVCSLFPQHEYSFEELEDLTATKWIYNDEEDEDVESCGITRILELGPDFRTVFVEEAYYQLFMRCAGSLWQVPDGSRQHGKQCCPIFVCNKDGRPKSTRDIVAVVMPKRRAVKEGVILR